MMNSTREMYPSKADPLWSKMLAATPRQKRIDGPWAREGSYKRHHGSQFRTDLRGGAQSRKQISRQPNGKLGATA